jgi:CHASE2 domain
MSFSAMNALDFLRTNRARAIIAETVLGLLLFFADPLGVVAYRARVIDDSISVLTQFMHGSEAREQLAVVLIDQEALDAWQVDWPLTYEGMAGLIHSLACAQAFGVFFDFTLSEKFNLAEGKDELESAVLDSRKGSCDDGSTPARMSVFFGKAEKIDSPLAQSLDRDHLAFSIDDDTDDSVYPAGSVEFPDSPVPIEQATPAFGVIRSVPKLWPSEKPPKEAAKDEDPGRPCSYPDHRPKCWMKPLALRWSGTIDPNQGDVADTVCRGFPGWLDIVASTFGITKEGRFEPCPPILTLKGQDLFRDREYIADYGNPARFLKDRFVFVGTELAGLNDEVLSPVHGYLPGVYKHAIAADNLLSYMRYRADHPFVARPWLLGTDRLLSYMKDMADYPTVPRPWLLGTLVVATYLLIEFVREYSRSMARRALILGLAALIALFAWGAIIHFLQWPWSLMLTVFGYYAGGVAILAVARFLSLTSEAEPHAPLDAKP